MGRSSDFFAQSEAARHSEYVSLAPPIVVNGVKGHLIKKKGDRDTHTSLPFFSNTSEVYFRQNAKGICQARVYVDHRMYLDFDWSHQHVNKSTDGRVFPVGVVHVQMWRYNGNGQFERISDGARYMNNAEMRRYGPLLKKVCPDIKFR